MQMNEVAYEEAGKRLARVKVAGDRRVGSAAVRFGRIEALNYNSL